MGQVLTSQVLTTGNFITLINFAAALAYNKASSVAAARAAKEHEIFRVALNVAVSLKTLAALAGTVILAMHAWYSSSCHERLQHGWFVDGRACRGTRSTRAASAAGAACAACAADAAGTAGTYARQTRYRRC